MCKRFGLSSQNLEKYFISGKEVGIHKAKTPGFGSDSEKSLYDEKSGRTQSKPLKSHSYI